MFRSLDRLVDLLRVSRDMGVIQSVLSVVILCFSQNETQLKKDYSETTYRQLFSLVKSFMHHQNMNNKTEINLCDYFRDDPGYAGFVQSTKSRPKEIAYDSRLQFECMHPSPLTCDYAA